MKINRLFAIVYILLDKKCITARELSEYFEVSPRTIYRDIEALSTAGIPIYTNKGKGGGISLVDNFVLNKSILTDHEQREILMSLQSLNVLKLPDTEPILDKLSILFKKQAMNWIDVDFSYWGSDNMEKQKFNLIKTAIFNENVVTFYYYNSFGQKSERIVEPLQLLFKGQSWYIYGYCRIKSDFRMFKMTRVKNLILLDETFIRDLSSDIWSESQDYGGKIIKLVLKIEEGMAYRVYDEFDEEFITSNDDGSYTVTVNFPENQWVYGYVLSYGNYAEVLEPEHVRESIKKMLEESLRKYI